MGSERLDKVLSHHGFGTRKDVRRLVRSGVVSVDGVVCTMPDVHMDPDTAVLLVNGEPVELRHHVYLMMNKPAGIVCSNRDGLHKTVFDLLSESYKGDFLGGSLHLVGRLDIDTEGLLLFTTDGGLTRRLTSPKSHVSKVYHVELQDEVPSEARPLISRRFADGIHIEADGDDDECDCKPAELEWLDGRSCRLVITEGRYHQVKRMFAAAGNKVVYLKRLAVDKLQLDPALICGEYRELLPEELETIR